MSKLPPPLIEGTIPAFYRKFEGERVEIIVPFGMSQAVSKNEIKNFYIKIKTIQTNEVLFTINTNESGGVDWDKKILYFTLSLEQDKKLIIGQYYKVQIAYAGNNEEGIEEVGYYSTVAIGKYTTYPQVKILNLDSTSVNLNIKNYTGVFSQENGDRTEKIYSYEFCLYDEEGNKMVSSGELLHNHETDEKSYETCDSYMLNYTLKEGQNYYIQYRGKTLNGVNFSSLKYNIGLGYFVPVSENSVYLKAEVDQENGYVTLTLDKKTAGLYTGHFVIYRSCSKDNYQTEEIMASAQVNQYDLKQFKRHDFTIEQGYSYIYSIQESNSANTIFSQKIYTDEIESNFEYCYLFDGKRQLKISLNPKISSFKEHLLESKVDTMGSRFPFYFKNGNVKYKEFPISGLISYQMDEQELFLNNEHMGLNNEDVNKIRTSNLSNYNIKAERIFKLDVLEFLNDGKPKLFRSPTEGNFIIRLMSNSLSPNDTLGRMLHTFSSQATEIAEFNFENLKKFGFLEQTNTQFFEEYLSWGFLDPSIILNFDEQGWSANVLINQRIKYLKCYNMLFGDQIKINGSSLIVIGRNGCYESYFDDMEIYSLQVKKGNHGMISYGYLYKEVDSDE